METEENAPTLKDYWQIVRRRKYIIIVPALILLAASIVAALILPPVYRSETTILIESQHIPTELVKSTVVSFADERIKQIQQKLMTVDNISKIIDKYNLYAKDHKAKNYAVLADVFRDSTSLEVINADVISNGDYHKATLAFKFAFDYKEPETAQKIANEMAMSILEENMKVRTFRAEETSKFLELEADKFKEDIRKTENEIASYKEKYSESLPELLPVNLAAINRIEGEIQQLELQEKLLIERRISLQTQLAITDPIRNEPATEDGRNELLESLPELQVLYKHLQDKYSDSHPDVKAIKRKIDSFKNAGTDSGQPVITNPQYLQLKSEIDIANVELQNINKQRETLRRELSAAEAKVSQTHQVERGYYELMRDLDSQKEKYQELRGKFLEAKLSQTLEEEQKGEKFSILEPARVPLKPVKPNRLKIVLMGFVFSWGCGFGLGFLFEMLDGSIRGHKALANLTGIEPLVVIPYIENQEDWDKDRKHQIYLAALCVLLLIGVVLAIHFLYMPLNVMAGKLLDRITMV